ncbi:MAG: hypothetical protein CMH23_07155 [Methylophaga sp.]|uniref:hypothetical protein n=1 Tax=Methylophaga sp. TaxID=2024840 RepID=UPI000C895DEE|nr:hypothetical protein [Methylophaga sp.]MBN46235.1 hypothetical protein [Methylophaga sp.]QDP56614.1 MAG: hypothetical protein GOVbin2380_49 [Prokaryotic dsDNA virus sp.]|tara:strand:- start:32436 stop:32702 length:267 start_codon:yes stop_codon:yes gene_type:complete
MQTEITVLGGLPVTIEFTVYPAEPDVGIMSDYIDEWSIVEIAGKPCKKSPDWLYKRIDGVKGEEDRIVEACFEAVNSYEPDYEPDWEY